MMLSSDAVHIGPLMLPWTLLVILLALMLTSLLIRFVAKKYHWSHAGRHSSQDLLWSSLIVGLLGARLVFVLLHAEIYFAQPIDILKIQDKGFHLYGGVMSAAAWYVLRNKAIQLRQSIALMLFCISIIAMGLALKQQLQPQVHFPQVKLLALDSSHQADKQVDLAQFIGQPTVVNLWASWCPPCHREMPVLAQAAKQYPAVQFVMLNQAEDPETVRAYLRQYQFQFQHVLLDLQGEVPAQINSFGLPTTLFFDAQGQMIARHMGELSPAMLQQYLKQISI